jgi:hypothetical protein
MKLLLSLQTKHTDMEKLYESRELTSNEAMVMGELVAE